MHSLHTTLLDDDTLYTIIANVVGDETSREFCTLTEHYLNDSNLDTAAQAHGTDWNTIKNLADEIETQARKHRENQ